VENFGETLDRGTKAANCHEDGSGRKLARFIEVFEALVQDFQELCQIPPNYNGCSIISDGYRALQCPRQPPLHPPKMADTLVQSWEYLETLPGADFFRLYSHPSSALAIFRKRLSSLAKTFVMTLLFMRQPLTASDIDLYVKPGSRKEREHAFDLLKRYHIFKEVTFDSAKAYSLTPQFAKSLRQALTGAGDGRSFGEVIELPPARLASIEQLDDYARRQWEGILGYMVGSEAVPFEDETPNAEPSKGVVELLKAGHLITLMGSASRGQKPHITKEGFAFVLQDVNTQIWTLLFQYVENAEVFDMTKVAILSFIFLVSSLELGLAYSSVHLDDTQLRILADLSDFGIVYQPTKPNGDIASHFYPTRLATSLTSESTSALSSTNNSLSSSLSTKVPSNSSPGFIIIETNYRLYAYTSSPLQIALLSLFVNLRSRHPNLVAGKMTKQSVQRAVKVGITAEQIIAYLNSHAHPQMRRHAQLEQSKSLSSDSSSGKIFSILPATVLDQIHLWQLERDRMQTTSGFLMKEFSNKSEYEGVARYAEEIGVLVWRDDRKRMFHVTRLDPIAAYLKERKNRAEEAT
jgi:transcription initiation factor TFIIH subunit 4